MIENNENKETQEEQIEVNIQDDSTVDSNAESKVASSDEELEDSLMKGVFDVSVDPETGAVGVKMMEQTPEISMIKEAFRSGDPNNPIVKNIRGARADLADEEGLAEVTPEMIYGKPN